MFRKRKLCLLLTSSILLVFFITVIKLMRMLSDTEIPPTHRNNLIHDQIYQQLANLPELYKIRTTTKDTVVDNFIVNINQQNAPNENFNTLWQEINSWVTVTQLTNFSSPKLGSVARALKHAKIISSDIDSRGTQLKLLLTLEVVIKKFFGGLVVFFFIFRASKRWFSNRNGTI